MKKALERILKKDYAENVNLYMHEQMAFEKGVLAVQEDVAAVLDDGAIQMSEAARANLGRLLAADDRISTHYDGCYKYHIWCAAQWFYDTTERSLGEEKA